MILYKNDRLQELEKLPNDNLYVLTDFDGTLTKGTNYSTWSSIFKNPNVTQEFVQKCINLYNHYSKYEVDNNITLKEKDMMMNEWYEKNIEILKEFKITRKIIKDSAKILSFREGLEDFFEYMNKNNIPVIILSAGIGDSIEQVLINNKCTYNNIYICSNYFEYDEYERVIGMKGNLLIQPLNKNKICFTPNINARICNRNNVLLLGNNISDAQIINNEKKLFKIGFLNTNEEKQIEDFKKYFDVVCAKSSSFYELKEILK